MTLNELGLGQNFCQIALENSPLFIGIYEPTQQQFDYVNQKGLLMFETEKLADFNLLYSRGIRQ